MANKKNHRRQGQQRRTEVETRAQSCGGEGHNGAIGRSKWKRLSARKERRTGTNIPPINPNRNGKKRPFTRPEIDESA